MTTSVAEQFTGLRPTPEIVIRPYTADEEYDRVIWHLQELEWLTANGYNVDLPDHPEFVKLTRPGADLSLLESDTMRELFAREVYDPDVYVERQRLIEADCPDIEQAIPVFLQLNERWGFKIYPKYEIVLTRYGTNGSYHPDTGRVVLSIHSPKRPRRTVIHEIAHLGVEKDLIKRFGLTHWEKERVIDHICMQGCGHILTDYEFQDRGDERLDSYIASATINDLPTAIERYVADYPRMAQAE